MSSDGENFLDRWQQRLVEEGKGDAKDYSISGYSTKRTRRGTLANMDSDTGGKRPGGSSPNRPKHPRFR